MKNTIHAINGPVIKVRNTEAFSMLEKVYVGPKRLMGEVISISKLETIIQVYESTSGLKPGDEVVGTGTFVSVVLGPGILGHIFDGIQRPLKAISDEEGIFISAGSQVASIDESVLWNVTITAKVGDHVEPGTIIGSVQETSAIKHQVMIPPLIKGDIVKVSPSGKYSLKDTIVEVSDVNGVIRPVMLKREWPIKVSRPTKERLPLDVPL